MAGSEMGNTMHQVSPQRSKQYDDWEDWETGSDTEGETTNRAKPKEGILIGLTPDTPSQLPGASYPGLIATPVASQPGQSIQKIRRLKSKQRQKAQNARAGIKVVTDMSQLQQQRPRHIRTKFVDAAALRALEGEPTSASVGSWNWLRKKASRKPGHARKASAKSIKTPITAGTDLSPNPAPIMIGISLSTEQALNQEMSPQTAVLETPIDIARYLPHNHINTNTNEEQAQKSVWSPDTNNGMPQTSVWSPDTNNGQPHKSIWSPDTPSTAFESPGRSSSIYSQATNFESLRMTGNVPPVPMVPAGFRNQQNMSVNEAKSPESEIPYTPFEEDKLSPLAAMTSKSPSAAATGKKGIYRSGWWDHLTSPFAPSPQSAQEDQSFNPFKGFTSAATHSEQVQRLAAKDDSTVSNEWWSGNDTKRAVPVPLKSPVHIVATVPSIHTVSPVFPSHEKGSPDVQTNVTTNITNNWFTVGPSAPSSAPTTRSVSPASSASGHASGSSSLTTMTGSNPFAQQAESVVQHQPQHQPQTQSEKARIIQEENAASEVEIENPPPYSYAIPPSRPVFTAKYAGAAPANLHLNLQPIPSPGMISPAMTRTMTSQGAIRMHEVMLTPPPPGLMAVNVGSVPDIPTRIPGTFIPGDHFQEARGSENKVERRRRRNEKEDAVARRFGGFWRGRGCIPDTGCSGRSGREGRKKRRLCCFIVIAVLILLFTLAIALPLTLIHKSSRSVPEEAEIASRSIWLNLTDFPPMPMGILTVAGPEKRAEVNGGVQPPTLWSCHLPKEDNDKAKPFDRDQPTIIFQVQFDNSSTRQWDTPQGAPPTSLPGGAAVGAGDSIDDTLEKLNRTENSGNTEGEANDSEKENPSDVLEGGLGNLGKRISGRLSRFLARTLLEDQILGMEKRADDVLFTPFPAAPSFQEMWFLGNTTDGIVDDNKAGEPTPFYITILSSLTESVGSDVLAKREDELIPDSGLDTIRDELDKNNQEPGDDLGTGVSFNLTDLLPLPELNPDGTGKKARMLPQPIQQPVRLYDRGLPSEHYGFYTFFDRTIYVQSAEVVPESGRDLVEADLEGGSLEVDAKKLATFSQTRFFVKIWTRQSDTTELNGGTQQPDGKAVAEADALTSTPGTFPYPVTFGTDFHGGNRTEKMAWLYGVDDDQHINRTDPKLILNNIAFDGTWINPGGSNDANELLGGFDGGTGGCKCVWENFKGLN